MGAGKKAFPLKTILSFLGPGFLVTVGFIDPGNWAANIEGGSRFGYQLLWVITISTIMLIVIQNGARVYLLHVVHSHTIDQERILREQAESWLGSRRVTLEDQGIEVDLVFRSGKPDREILKEIEEKNYDLVAMATHGHSWPLVSGKDCVRQRCEDPPEQDRHPSAVDRPRPVNVRAARGPSLRFT